MRGGEALDEVLTLGGEGEEDFAAVIGGDFADDGGALDQLIDDADGAVMADLQLLGEVANRELAIAGGGADGEQGLVLVRGEVFGNQQVFAEAQKFSQLIPESGEGLKICGCHDT